MAMREPGARGKALNAGEFWVGLGGERNWAVRGWRSGMGGEQDESTPNRSSKAGKEASRECGQAGRVGATGNCLVCPRAPSNSRSAASAEARVPGACEGPQDEAIIAEANRKSRP